MDRFPVAVSSVPRRGAAGCVQDRRLSTLFLEPAGRESEPCSSRNSCPQEIPVDLDEHGNQASRNSFRFICPYQPFLPEMTQLLRVFFLKIVVKFGFNMLARMFDVRLYNYHPARLCLDYMEFSNHCVNSLVLFMCTGRFSVYTEQTE